MTGGDVGNTVVWDSDVDGVWGAAVTGLLEAPTAVEKEKNGNI